MTNEAQDWVAKVSGAGFIIKVGASLRGEKDILDLVLTKFARTDGEAVETEGAQFLKLAIPREWAGSEIRYKVHQVTKGVQVEIGRVEADREFLLEVRELGRKANQVVLDQQAIDMAFEEKVEEEIKADPRVVAMERALGSAREVIQGGGGLGSYAIQRALRLEAELEGFKQALRAGREGSRESYHYVVGGRDL